MAQDIDWGKLLPIILQLGGQIWGAQNTNSTNSANTAAVNARQQMLQNLIFPQLQQQQGQNPYAAALTSFLGMPGAGARPTTAFSPFGTGNAPQTTTQGGGGTLIGYTTGGQPIYAPQGSGASASASASPAQSAQRYFLPNPEGGSQEYGNLQDFVAAGGQAPAAAQAAAPAARMGMGNFTLTPEMIAQYRATMAQVLPLGSEPVSEDVIRADIARTLSAYGQGGAAQSAGITGGGQYANSNGIGQMPGQGPVLSLPSGYPQNPSQPFTPTPSPTQPGVPPFDPNSPMPGDPGYPTGPSSGQPQGIPSGDAGGMPSMFRYSSPGQNAFTYTPPTLGAAPTVTGVQGFNAGQDALMQMLRRDNGASPANPSTGFDLQQLSDTGSPFNNSELFAALEPMDQRLIDRNVSQLHASAGSLGERLGSSINRNEAQLREQLGQDVLARNAGIQSQSYEAAQGRRLQALGLGANIAQGLAGSLGQTDALNLQAQMANQGVAAQYGLHGADIANQAGQFNAQQRQGQFQFDTTQGNAYNQLIMSGLGQAFGMDQSQGQSNIQLLSLLAGLPIGVQQPNAFPGAVGDIGSLLMLLPYLQGLGGGSRTNSVPTGTPTYSSYWNA